MHVKKEVALLLGECEICGLSIFNLISFRMKHLMTWLTVPSQTLIIFEVRGRGRMGQSCSFATATLISALWQNSEIGLSSYYSVTNREEDVI